MRHFCDVVVRPLCDVVVRHPCDVVGENDECRLLCEFCKNRSSATEYPPYSSTNNGVINVSNVCMVMKQQTICVTPRLAHNRPNCTYTLLYYVTPRLAYNRPNCTYTLLYYVTPRLAYNRPNCTYTLLYYRCTNTIFYGNYCTFSYRIYFYVAALVCIFI